METKTSDLTESDTKSEAAAESRSPDIDPNLLGALEMAAALALAPFSRH